MSFVFQQLVAITTLQQMKKMSSKISFSSRSCKEDRLGSRGEKRVFWEDRGATKLFRDEGLIRYLSGLDTGLKMSNSSIKESSHLAMRKRNMTQEMSHNYFIHQNKSGQVGLKSMIIYIPFRMLRILRFPYIKATLLHLTRQQFTGFETCGLRVGMKNKPAHFFFFFLVWKETIESWARR